MEAIGKTRPEPGLTRFEAAMPTPGPGQVLIEVESASVCGTDYGLADWTEASAVWGSQLPLIMGHEYVGRIVEVGPGVTNRSIGQRVAGESHASCGKCKACQRDARHNCLNLWIPGVSHNGAFASHVAVPESACFPLDDRIGPEAVLFESAGVAIHAIQQAGDVSGRTCLITGAGPVGLFLISALRALGAGHIAVLEPNRLRRERAAGLGAEAFDIGQNDDLLAFCKENSDLRGADIGFEVSGSSAAYDTQFSALGLESTLISVGHTSKPVEVNISSDINLRVLTWKGVYGRRIWSSWELLQDLVLEGRMDLASFVEGEFHISDLPTSLDDIKALPGKVLVRP